jgi:hypothetical protein
MARVSRDEMMRAYQTRLARIAIGTSTLRGKGNVGAARAARGFLARLDVQPFAVTDEGRFASALDDATDALRKCLPQDARHWGLARKAVNIFLRDCMYSRHLSDHFNLIEAAPFMEIPLDGVVGRRLADLEPTLPRWVSIKGLTRETSDKFQLAAKQASDDMGVLRVDLDAIWWGGQDTEV